MLVTLFFYPILLQSQCPTSCPEALSSTCNSYTCEAGGDPRDVCKWGGTGCPFTNQTVIAGCCCNATPIILDMDGDGVSLTSARDGVRFDIGDDGKLDRVSWTQSQSRSMWLTLDRNRNGKVDDGKELFGNATPQQIPPPGHFKNGFLALAAFDTLEKGGNGDGILSASDSIFAELRAWQDRNHNGISEPDELYTLSSLGITALELDYKESRRTDEYGNKLRYRAKVRVAHGSSASKWAWDVILLVDNSAVTPTSPVR